ncbi:MAG: holdfast anchor protein HfaD [Caulobacterales bacterium]|nr:holdfast anchor protein HfaD [Caulobacterales bacterium]
MAAAPVIALLCAAGTSQAQTPPSEVINNQIQLGDVFSTQTLDVVSVTEGVGAETTSTGNNLVGSTEGADLNITSNQTMAGSTISSTTVNVTGEMGESSQINTTAIGNNVEAGTTQGTMAGVYTQIATAAPEVTATGMLEADAAEAGDVGMATTAAVNSVSLGLTNGSAGVLVNQTSAAWVLADGGAVIGYVSGTADVSGTAAGNTMSLVGTDSSAARAIVFQSNAAALTQASQFTAYGNVQTASTSASASGNVAATTNEGVLLDLTSTQFNQSYVRAQAESAAYQYGEGAATAYGVGNSVLAGNSGEAVVLENVQLNTGGGVEAIATFAGVDGYDGYARATAVGNDVTGYACATCFGQMTIDSRQTNSADVGATATTTIGSGRVANSSATAVGNNASFYVTRPGS